MGDVSDAEKAALLLRVTQSLTTSCFDAAYDKYCKNITENEIGVPVPRSMFIKVCKVQAIWRGKLAKRKMVAKRSQISERKRRREEKRRASLLRKEKQSLRRKSKFLEEQKRREVS